MVFHRCWPKKEEEESTHIESSNFKWKIIISDLRPIVDHLKFLQNEFNNIEISQTGREYACIWPSQIRSHVYDERVWTRYSIGIESKLFEIISCPIKILPYRKCIDKCFAFLARIVKSDKRKRLNKSIVSLKF